MPPGFFNRIESVLYAERINAYRQDGADELMTLARYMLNMALSESLYSSLQFAEIALRNSIHAALTHRAKSDEWYNTSPFLLSWQHGKVDEARTSLKKRGKEMTSGRVVAELSFGFWTAFFNKGSDRNGIGHYLASTAFPHAPKPERSLRRLARRWENIRRLRNRVFHHERIIHWGDLSRRHEEILELIAWMEPDLEILTREADRFKEIYHAGIGPWYQRICARWGAV